MRRREPEAAGGYLFNGKVYTTETAYLAAREKNRVRRRRLLAAVSDESPNVTTAGT